MRLLFTSLLSATVAWASPQVIVSEYSDGQPQVPIYPSTSTEELTSFVPATLTLTYDIASRTAAANISAPPTDTSAPPTDTSAPLADTSAPPAETTVASETPSIELAPPPIPTFASVLFPTIANGANTTVTTSPSTIMSTLTLTNTEALTLEATSQATAAASFASHGAAGGLVQPGVGLGIAGLALVVFI